MTDAHHYAVRRVFNARHLANLAALDYHPRSRAYACGEQAALAERATAFNAPADLHAHLDALAEVMPQDALMVSLHSNLGDDAAWAAKHGPLRPLASSASYFSSHAVLVRAAYAYDLAHDQERQDAERHNDVRYLWTAKRLDLRLYTLIPSLAQHDNLPSLLGNPQAPRAIPRSSRTYAEGLAGESAARILAALSGSKDFA